MTRFWVAAAAIAAAIAPALALDGQPAMHDPSTVIEAGGGVVIRAIMRGAIRVTWPVKWPVYHADTSSAGAHGQTLTLGSS